MKRKLRIRLRAPVSGKNFDHLAGRHVGHEEGYAAGVRHQNNLNSSEIKRLIAMVKDLRSKLSKEEASFGQLAHAHNKKVGEHLRLSQEVAMLRAREDVATHSDLLFLPPFGEKNEPWKDPKAMALRNEQLPPTRAKMNRIEAIRQMYGGSPIGAMASVQTGRSMSREWLQMALNPATPPDNPMVHIDFAQAESRTAIAMRDLAVIDSTIFRVERPELEETAREVDEIALRAARHTQIPFQVGSEVRTAEEQEHILRGRERERVRRASANGEGVTDRAGGHSHAIDIDVQLDPEIREALDSLERFREAFGNAGISAETMARMLDRLASLEERVEEQAPSRESEEEINLSVRSSPPGEE